MIENYEQIKKYVLILTGFEESAKLDLEIRSIIMECLEYCYRDDVPDAMIEPLADVISTELQRRKDFGFGENITSYREGDMSISYSQNSLTSSSIKYLGKLEGFKRVIGAKPEKEEKKCSETHDAQ